MDKWYILKSKIYQLIIDAAKKAIEENSYPKNNLTKKDKKLINDKRIASFGEKMKINLEDALKPYLNQMLLDILEKEMNNIFQSSTSLNYIENLINEKVKNQEFKFGKKFLKNMFNVAKLIIEKVEFQKKEENKAKTNISKKRNIIINDTNNNCIKFDEKSINNFFNINYNSDEVSSLKVDIFGNKEQKENIFIENVKNKDITTFSGKTTNDINIKIKENKDEIKIKIAHLINIIKNMIMEQFIKDFNKANKSNYILEKKKEKTKKKAKKNK